MNIFMVDLREKFFFDFLDPIKQAPALTVHGPLPIYTDSVHCTVVALHCAVSVVVQHSIDRSVIATYSVVQ